MAQLVARLHGMQKVTGSNPVSSTGKSDGVIATIMALDRAIRGGSAQAGTSVYDERGLLVL